MEPVELRTILVAGSDPEMRTSCEAVLQPLGYSIKLAQDGTDALSCLRFGGKAVDAVLLDIVQEGPAGFDTLKVMREFNPELPVIVVSSLASSENIVSAMRMGAADFVRKPVEHEQLSKAVRRIIEREPSHFAPAPNSFAPATGVFQGSSPSIRRVQAIVGTVGWSEAPVLIQGETGTGKEVIARQLHARSRRSSKPFLKVNCAALPSELIESELFGYERGAFTGAVQKRIGLFEDADGGTLLLDEIGDMDCRLQSRLLHVLQDSSFLRVGGREMIRVDVRVMAATHCNLESAIANRTFRQDLFYRLNVINIHLPALRECKDDLLQLTTFLISKHATPGVPVPVMTAELREALMTYDWPGNIRELENCVRKLLIFGDPELIARELQIRSRFAIRAGDTGVGPGTHAKEPVLARIVKDEQRLEADAILSALNSTCWNRRRAAALLQIDYNRLRLKMKKLGIGPATSVACRAGAHGC
jgi:two-component system response regulator AtoC